MIENEKLEHLINEYGNEILRMCYLYLKDYQLAEDAVQETFIKIMKSYDSFLHQSSEKTWIIRIAINTCKNIMRNHWFSIIQSNIEDYLSDEKVDPMQNILEKDSITRAIMKLNINDRKIIILYYYQELSVNEIAEIIGKTQNATLQQLHRARKKLKKILMEEGYNEIGF